jgi:hypothetical protein
LAEEVECPPGPMLMESMRAVGYSLATALADIIDNSISAESGNVDIHYSATEDEPYIAILDDGNGMSRDEAHRAMQLAGNGVIAERTTSDLGRFGLGLKTASLSQCRKFVVISKKMGVTTGLVWDLDHLIAKGSWSLKVLSQGEIRGVQHSADLESSPNGTLVVWTQLDRFLGQSREIVRELDTQMMESKRHLSLIFHQFLNGDGVFSKVKMAINGGPLIGVDPFLARSRRTQKSSVEVIRIDDVDIEVQSYTLPFIGKMTSAERELAQVPGALRDSQGFYIYRGGRLVIWGTWFRFMPKNDTGKLTRVKVDIPNSLDHLWSLDIKKSSAVPPRMVRERLRHLAGTMLEPSHKIHQYRGRKAKVDDPLVRPWELVEDRDEFRYSINREHPMFAGVIAESSPSLLRLMNQALTILEDTFPVHDLYNRMSGDRVPKQEDQDFSVMKEVLLKVWALERSSGESVGDFVARMTHIEPWDKFEDNRIELENWLISGSTGAAE